MPKRPNLCKFCPPDIRGLCCYYSAFIKGFQVVQDEHCKFLDPATRLCTVYKERFEENPDCLTLREMKAMGSLPRKCPYVQFDKEYQSRTDLRLYADEFEVIVKRREDKYRMLPITKDDEIRPLGKGSETMKQNFKNKEAH